MLRLSVRGASARAPFSAAMSDACAIEAPHKVEIHVEKK